MAVIMVTMSSAARKTIPEEKPVGLKLAPGTGSQPSHGWIERLLKDEGKAILRTLWRVLGNEEEVIEAYQECWCALVAVAKPGQLRSAKAFAYRTAINVAIEMIRRKARRRGHLPAIVERYKHEAIDDEPARFDDELKERLRQNLEKLPRHLQRVVVLRDFGGRNYRDIADVLGIDAGTARVYRRQAVLRLAELMECP